MLQMSLNDLVAGILGGDTSPSQNNGCMTARHDQTAALVSALLSNVDQLNHVGSARLDKIESKLASTRFAYGGSGRCWNQFASSHSDEWIAARASRAAGFGNAILSGFEDHGVCRHG